ncbi:PLP-dependent aminotransferase family protein [Eubacteriaceae bacterium ES2]|nr:PLP-dependent aminotransferase family protein [Eubacteriaceae bacterium ES2]
MIYLDKQNSRPLYEQLYSEIKKDIVNGTLQKNTALSSLRALEKELQVSRNTVDRAYQQLLAEGYIRSVQGSGYFIEDIKNDYFYCSDVMTKETVKEESSSEAAKIRYDFEYASIDSDLFPWSKWKEYIHDAILDESCNSELTYETNKGNEFLRKGLCDFLSKHRGVICKPEQIVICPGTQNCMDILTNLLPNGSNRIAFEDPGYDAMRYLLESRGYSITSVSVLEDGVDVDFLQKTNCNVLYITPSHQFPTGIVTPISKRNRILQWACENDAYIIENDYDSEFKYGSLPIPSLQSLDQCEKVIYIGTLSKVLSPSIRCAYIVLPEALVPKYDYMYKFYNAALPSYHQIALAHFINDGLLEKHIRRVSVINEKKYNTLVKSIKAVLSDEVEVFDQPAGVHTLVRIKNCTNQKEFLQKLRQASVAIYGIKMHWHDQSEAKEDTFLMGFNSMTEEDLRNGCKKMAQVLKEIIKE